MSVGKRTYSIYGPPHFRATWEKFLEICKRDGVSASRLIRIWVEGYVRRKEPGNPQRPLTAWVPGHEDHLAMNLNEVVRKLEGYASARRDEIDWWTIIRELSHLDRGADRLRAAERISQELQRRGIKVWR